MDPVTIAALVNAGKNLIPSHTDLGKILGSTNQSAGIDLSGLFGGNKGSSSTTNSSTPVVNNYASWDDIPSIVKSIYKGNGIDEAKFLEMKKEYESGTLTASKASDILGVPVTVSSNSSNNIGTVSFMDKLKKYWYIPTTLILIVIVFFSFRGKKFRW